MQRDVYDAIVIDKIFQPICDSMAEKISCFKISHFLLDGMPIFFLYVRHGSFVLFLHDVEKGNQNM